MMAILCAVLSLTSAQWVGGDWEELLHLDGVVRDGRLGQSVAGLSDFDHDGRLDFAIGSEKSQPLLPIYSGADTRILGHVPAPPGTYSFGHAVARLGDIDLDGVPDFGVAARVLVGSTDRYCVYLFSGRTAAHIGTIYGTLYFQTTSVLHFGHAMACPGDLDGDGVPDLVIGDAEAFGLGSDQPGAAFVFSGATFAVLSRLNGAQDGCEFGTRVLACGDLDGDGVGDFAVSAPSENGAVTKCGAVHVFSGATRALLWSDFGVGKNDMLGLGIASLPDLDGDGAPELALGGGNGTDLIGRVLARSGASGALLWERTVASENFGYSLAAMEDFDGDGLADLAVGATTMTTAGTTNRGGIYAISGADGELLLRHGGFHQAAGSLIAALDDAQSDGIGELLCSSPDADIASVRNVGTVSLLSFRPGLELSTSELSASTGGSVGLRIEFSAARAGSFYAVLLSAAGTGPITMSGIEVPLSSDNLFHLARVGSYPFPGVGLRGRLDAGSRAEARARLDSALLAGQVGRTLWWAAVAGTSGAVESSSIARSVTITP